MGSTGWTADPLNVTYPPGAIAPATFIYIGDAAGDPTGALTIAGLDAGMVLGFGNGYAYVFGIFQEVGFNDAHLYLAGVDPFAASLGDKVHRIIETDWQPSSAGGAANFLEIGDTLQSIVMSGGSLDISAQLADITMSSNGNVSIHGSTSGTITLGNTTFNPVQDQVVNVDGQLWVAGNEVGRGIWMSVADTASSAAIGAQAVVLTLPSKTYKKGRAYRIYCHAGVIATTAGALADLRFFKGGIGGQALGELYRSACIASGVVYPAHGLVEFTVGANDVTTTIVLTLAASAGTIQHFGAAGSPRSLTVEDIGRATQVSGNLPVLV